MTDLNKTEIVVILDRSGSMSSIQKDMEGGFDTFIAGQRALPGECAVSLYQFDDEYEAVYEGKPIASVPNLALLPRGGTALLDAMGKTIVSVGERLKALAERSRPAAVIVMVITDGYENASKEYTRARVSEMVKHQETAYRWQFMYLGADVNAIAEAASMGIATAAVYSASAGGVQGMTNAIGSSSKAYRSAVRSGNLSASVKLPQDLTTKDDE